jgi:hypothetical protein
MSLWKPSRPPNTLKKLWGVLINKRPNHTPLRMMMNRTNNNLFEWMMKTLLIIMHSECIKEWKVGLYWQFGVRGCHFD